MSNPSSVTPAPESPPTAPTPLARATPEEMDVVLQQLVSDTDRLVQALTKSLKESEDVDALEARLLETGVAESEEQRAVAAAVFRARRAQVRGEQDKKERAESRKMEKRAGVGKLKGNTEVLQGVVGAAGLALTQKEERRLGVDAENWMDFFFVYFLGKTLDGLVCDNIGGAAANDCGNDQDAWSRRAVWRGRLGGCDGDGELSGRQHAAG